MNWVFNGDAPDHYTVEVNPDGTSGFMQADLDGNGTIDGQDQVAGSQARITISLSLHLLTDFNNGLYRIVARDGTGAEIGASNSISLMSVVVNQLVGYVKASNAGAEDNFGRGVALAADGNTLAVAADGESGKAVGIGGDESDNRAAGAGAVYVFSRDSVTGVWSQQAYVKASNAEAGDRFGSSLALAADGGTLAVGAFKEESNATGVGGDESDNSAGDAGAVYVFTRNGATWEQQAYVKASNAEVNDFFGNSIALAGDGDTLAVGAVQESSSATGIGGDEGDNSASKSGAVYVFTRSGTSWAQQAYVKASNAGASDFFGVSIALAGDGRTLAVGADGESSSALGIGGDESDNSADESGAVYVFTRSGTAWAQQAYLKASNADMGDSFGVSIALASDGNTLAVGADRESSGATVIGGDQSDNSTNLSGAAYVFTRSGATWQQEAYIKASNADAADLFGGSIALANQGNILAVGAYLEDGKAAGINDDDSDNTVSDAGAVYVFTRSGSAWSQRTYVKAFNAERFDYFGSGIALARDGNTLAAGAHLEDSKATGINGDDSDNGESKAGAVYLY
ncbi:hypothetical protein GN155_011885 [Alcanivorax sp. ZXX171]|nr:hypothetical protein [Alcanivorax sp. ZXX171]